MDDGKRDHIVMARFNQDELRRLDALRDIFGMSRAKYIRTRALGDNLPRVARVPDLNLKAWTDLSRAAGNLNQIAHRLNERRMSDTLGDLSIGEISYVLKEFRMALIGAASDLTYEDDE